MDNIISEEKLIEFLTIFEMFDKDRDGSISTKELSLILRNLGENPTENELLDIIKEIDTNSDGKVEFKEFIWMLIKKTKDPDMDDEMKDAFNYLSRDVNEKKPKIPTHEMRSVLKSTKIISDLDIEEIIKEADLDGDGQIDCDELIRMMNSK